MHLNSFNKLVKYLLETNEGVFRYSDLTGEPQLEPGEDIYFTRYRYDNGRTHEVEISEEEFEKMKKELLREIDAGYFTFHGRDYFKRGQFTNRTNKKLFNSQGYIKKLEDMLSRHLNHKIVLFLNDTEEPQRRPFTDINNSDSNHKHTSVAIEVPSDVIGLELSMHDNEGDDIGLGGDIGLTMLSPWMVGHRLGHQMPYNVARGVYDILYNLMKSYVDISRPYEYLILPIEKLKQMFNFKSLNDDVENNFSFALVDDRVIGEFYREVFAQYAKYGRIFIHNIGTDTEREEATRKIGNIFSQWLDTLRGEVINIDE